MEEYYDGAGVLVESFVLGDCHVADAPRNDVLDLAPRNDVPVACALDIPAGQWHTLRALVSGTVILEMKDGAYEPITPADILSMSFRGVGCASCYSSAHISFGHGGEGRVRSIDVTVTPYAAPQSEYTPSDCCSPSPAASSAKGLAAGLGWCGGD